jgi:hypothetical protein
MMYVSTQSAAISTAGIVRALLLHGKQQNTKAWGQQPRSATQWHKVCCTTQYAHTPKIERIISLLSASPVGEARLPMPKGMAYKD